jgi:hypothetical protein
VFKHLSATDIPYPLKYIIETLVSTLYPLSYGWSHRVGRVLSFFSSRRDWGSPNPSPAGECAPTLWVRGKGHTRWRERGRESPNSEERTYTLVLYIWVYFAAGVIMPLKVSKSLTLKVSSFSPSETQQRESFHYWCGNFSLLRGCSDFRIYDVQLFCKLNSIYM